MSCLQPPSGRSDHSSISSRPKLTLQTTSLPLTFGRSTTGLSRSFAATATASPTVRNTFKNAYDATSPTSTTTSPTKISSTSTSGLRLNTTAVPIPIAKPISPYIHHTNPNNSPYSYRSPYSLPLGVRSILRNSPLEGASRRRSGSVSAGAGGPGGAGVRRVFFPAKKQVSFRHILEEEIRTERYTAQHLDLVREEAVHEADSGASNTNTKTHTHTHSHIHTAISVIKKDDEAGIQLGSASGSTSGSGSGSGSWSDSDSSSLSVSESSTDEGSTDKIGARTSLSKEERKKRRTLRVERQVRAVALLDGLEANPYSSTPQTPRQSRVKRRREWKWTLGPDRG
ncbi:hypothetical protein N7481_005870 [Penicillium waksmanii]|uniref:uncharacterized protein n=1 Tax=Penicillium waksmanii TaxID=69791 RepID=UPI002549826B|nr:uncharacterized protein N7481_005870 [Penicillium waksmanii]KAJ5983771.1 hypothetical protein N7481_005870 [Penicillium waksmanii]